MIVILLVLHSKFIALKNLLSKFSININEHVYLKNPESSDLGKKIIKGSTELIEELGFENFTFKKLGSHIGSPEASIYRYFENKHYMLTYLVHWYWGWMEYRMVMAVMNVECPRERLKRCINLLTGPVTEDLNFGQVNEIKLHAIVVSESSKIYMSKQVDADNAHGLFKPYKDLVQRVSEIILEINPQYKYPHMLVSTIIEGANHQRYFAEHLPRLTDIVEGEDSIISFYQELTTKLI